MNSLNRALLFSVSKYCEVLYTHAQYAITHATNVPNALTHDYFAFTHFAKIGVNFVLTQCYLRNLCYMLFTLVIFSSVLYICILHPNPKKKRMGNYLKGWVTAFDLLCIIIFLIQIIYVQS